MDFASRAEYRSRIEQVVVYINDHLNGHLDLASVAAVSHFSPYHFHRIFHGAMNETPQAYINRLRLERAANYLMKFKSMSVTDIALACGFSSSSSFARAFKQHFGVSAREYASGRYLRSLADACNSQVCTMAMGETPAWNVEIKDIPPLHLACLPCLQGYSLPQICGTWERLDRWAVAHRALRPDTIRLGISMDDPTITPEEKCRYLAAITIHEEIVRDRLVSIMDVPAMTCAVFHVELLIDQFQSYYHSVYRDWLPDSGLQPADFPCYEVYLQPPSEDTGGAYHMDIHIPVVPI